MTDTLRTSDHLRGHSAARADVTATDLRRVALLHRLAELGSEIQLATAELQALNAPPQAEASPEMLSVANVASLLGISKDAARMVISRRGVGVRVGGRVQVPRKALPTLYRDRSIVRGDVRFVRSHLDRDASMIPTEEGSK